MGKKVHPPYKTPFQILTMHIPLVLVLYERVAARLPCVRVLNEVNALNGAELLELSPEKYSSESSPHLLCCCCLTKGMSHHSPQF